MEALRRVRANTVEKRLLNERGLPNFGLNFYMIDGKGRHAGVTLNGRARFAVCDEGGPRLEDCEPLAG
jgi:N4-(beta-N-acetylglucosaminyl)-L-asparaginase